jgi:elongation factor P--beta-lysine ligase
MKIVEEVLDEKQSANPVFMLDYFTFLSPLAKAKPDNPAVAQRFEFFIAGMEVGNAYSELNDPRSSISAFWLTWKMIRKPEIARSTRILSGPWSTACLRPVVLVSALTGWSCC